MPYTNLTSRSDVAPLVPEEVSKELLGAVTDTSAVLQTFRRIPVSRNAVRFPVLSALPVAYWVNGDTGLKQTTEMAWSNKTMHIEEIATIVPVPDNVLADVEVNVWDEAMPYLTEAVARTLDEAVFFGVNAPGTFPTNLNAAAAAAGNDVTEGATAAEGGFFGDLDAAIGLLEDDGYDPSAIIAARSLRGRLRTARMSTGERLDQGRASADLTGFDGMNIVYPMRGQWPAGGAAGTSVRAFVGDFSEFVVGVRQDITVDVHNEGVIQDNTGAIVYNLLQQDMSALRLKFRVGWQVANRLNRDRPTESERYPVAVIRY